MDAATPIAVRRHAACQDLLAQARTLLAPAGATPEVLARLRDGLVALASDHADLFPLSDFRMPDAQGVNHMLDDAANDGLGLYLTIGLPGKEAAPHDHGIWCVNAAVSGAELQRFYRLAPQSAGHQKPKIEEIGRVVVEPGVGMVMADHDIHSTDVLGDQPFVGLAMYGYAINKFPAVVWYHTQFAEVRACASRRPGQ